MQPHSTIAYCHILLVCQRAHADAEGICKKQCKAGVPLNLQENAKRDERVSKTRAIRWKKASGGKRGSAKLQLSPQYCVRG